MAQLLGSSRPTRRAAADAAAKIAVQSQNVSISQLAQVAAAERAAAGGGAAGGSGRGGKGNSSGGAGGKQAAGGSGRGSSAKRRQRKGPYILPPDELAGSWRLVADDIESVQAVGEALAASERPADVEVGNLLLQQVVATLLERKQHEEKVSQRGEEGRETLVSP
jgi:hypothetical protein